MRGSRNFRQGGPGQSAKKSSDNLFFFLVLSLFYRSQMVNFKEIYHFSRFQRGPTFSRGGVQLFPGGSNCLFPIETHITCDFPRGIRTPCPPPPLDPHLLFSSFIAKTENNGFVLYIPVDRFSVMLGHFSVFLG